MERFLIDERETGSLCNPEMINSVIKNTSMSVVLLVSLRACACANVFEKILCRRYSSHVRASGARLAATVRQFSSYDESPSTDGEPFNIDMNSTGCWEYLCLHSQLITIDHMYTIDWYTTILQVFLTLYSVLA